MMMGTGIEVILSLKPLLASGFAVHFSLVRSGRIFFNKLSPRLFRRIHHYMIVDPSTAAYSALATPRRKALSPLCGYEIPPLCGY